ncbi:3-hydroxyacyl-CoA dehydrogenase [Terrabacter sp. Root85]|uniref:3-hydroxyacyl-CoA dehydrogenase NAD-binding domain-containing protein n=1 Tax=unclassified Terrabacter TaxID=2630222 RepID=UPI0007017DD6|nr:MULTISPECIES: 3-hydroxyacyl-CoA dehydrogenase NAD-binding domain-containing protein [unclassified Terrabacter]KRC88818.1 3-hydroxyacyl-CoA dehydrogenase [Terrabacter sp. Root85]KRF45704.1 3-hydroxyacyl-CoA dehydrogenase [Terrabacter sp. Soil811]
MDRDTTEASTDHPDQSAFGPVGVIGAGAMGAGIAQVAATAGHAVTLVDSVPGAAAGAVDTIGAALKRLVDKGRLSDEDASAVLARITPAASVEELPECGLVIEAVPEDLDLKRRIFADLADVQPSTTVLATNTSSIDIDDIAAEVADPERVLGLHFFNPPPVMRLVEVVHGERTARAFVEHAVALMDAWGKTPVRCSSTPGFIVNRVARPFYGEAQRIVESGVADAATVDWALREKGGFPMGPLELTDFIGQDVNLAVGTSVWEQTGRDERYAPTAFQQGLVEAGRLGRKTGSGVYAYAADGSVTGAEPDVELAERLVGGPVATDPLARTLAMLVNEAVDLVARGEASVDDVDTAMQLGTRYPKGPIAWGREIGFDVVARQLTELDEAFPGGRYRPSPALTDGSLT